MIQTYSRRSSTHRVPAPVIVNSGRYDRGGAAAAVERVNDLAARQEDSDVVQVSVSVHIEHDAVSSCRLEVEAEFRP